MNPPVNIQSRSSYKLSLSTTHPSLENNRSGILLEIGFKGISQIGKVNNPVKGLKDLNSNIDIHNWQSTSELLYTTEVRSWKNIIDDINKKINSQINEKEIRIGLLTHSQIMCKSDWKYFQRIVQYLRSSGTEFINASAIIN